MNPFKQALAERRPQIGLWQSLANPYTAEICAGAGFDWLLFDGEHAPNTVQTLLAQLQAVAAYPVEPVARPPIGEAAVIKQYLDIGCRSLLIPMVESADQAARLVAATRFPPVGMRGVASATSRASGFGANAAYLARAHEDICLLVQIESRTGLDAIEAIAAVDGVDGLFIGPQDLAGSLGHLGDPRHPTVQSAIEDALKRIAAAGKPAGLFALDAEDARARLGRGVAFVSTGTDIGLLARNARALAAECRPS
ncbi:MAG TPA: HpcH/HpaI aldolase/citrate lyase family protein [Caulobacteraceae bacterium]